MLSGLPPGSIGKAETSASAGGRIVNQFYEGRHSKRVRWCDSVAAPTSLAVRTVYEDKSNKSLSANGVHRCNLSQHFFVVVQPRMDRPEA